jgi:hypothetical protein
MQGQDGVCLTCLKYLLSQAKLTSSFILFLASIVRTHQSNTGYIQDKKHPPLYIDNDEDDVKDDDGYVPWNSNSNFNKATDELD